MLKTVLTKFLVSGYSTIWEASGSPTLEETLKDINSDQNMYLLDIIEKERYSRLLEVGSGCGSRLIGLALKNPDKSYFGIDLSFEAITSGKSFAKNLGLDNLEFKRGNLITAELQPCDVILSWATLMYIHPVKINLVVKKLIDRASQSIIIIEPRAELGINSRYSKMSKPGFSYRFDKKFTKLDARNKFYLSEVVRVPHALWKPGMGTGYLYKFMRTQENHECARRDSNPEPSDP